MFRNNLFRTSSFRLTLISTAVFFAALLLLLHFVIASTETMMERQNDLPVEGEITEIFNETKGGDLASLAATVARMSTASPQYFYALQSKDGQHLAGNLPKLDPVIGFHEWQGQPLNTDTKTPRIRGTGLNTIDDAYLFVGVRAYNIEKMYNALTRSFLWMMGVTFVAVLFGGLFMSSRMLARVEAVSRISREIVSGNLQRRLPVNGTNDEFDHLAVSLNVMLDRIQDLMEGLRQVSSDIAHDLRTPLTRLRQRLEHTRCKATSVEELREALDQSINHVDSILAIFSSLLRIAQIESGLRRSGFKNLDLAEVLEEVTGLYKPVFDEKMQTLSLNLSGKLMICGDQELLTQLFVNILDNATNHTPERCFIEIKGRLEGDHILVEVADNGPGIPEAQRSKVLQRFYRLEQSRSTPGHGLGLSLVEAVTAQHDGQIDLLDNHPGLLIRITFKASATELMLPGQLP